jgi:hypothetical protein
MRAVRAAAVAVALFVLTCPSGAGASDFADIVVPLPMHAQRSAVVTDLLVDAVHGRIFVSSRDGKVTAVSMGGQIVRTVHSEGGEMVVAGSALYVGSCGNKTVTKFDATTLDELDTFNVASGMPCNLAWASHRLWFSSSASATLRSVALTRAHTTKSYPSIPAGQFAVAPDGMLYTIGGGELSKIDVSGTDPVVVAQTAVTGQDIAVSPDGQTVAVATASSVKLFDTDLIATGSSVGGWLAVAFSPDGAYVATRDTNSYGIYPVGSATPALTVDAGYYWSTPTLYARHVAFSPDSSKVYAISEDETGAVALHIVTIPSQPSYATMFPFQPSGSATLGQPATISGDILSSPAGGVAGRTISGVLRDPYGNEIDAGSTTTDSAGHYSLTTTPELRLTGDWTITLTVQPAAPYRAVSVDGLIRVSGETTTATLIRSRKTVVYGSEETLTGQLSAYVPGVTTLRIHRVVDGKDTVLGSGTVDPSGLFQFTFTPKRNATYWAEHQSDDTYDPSSSERVPVNVVPIIAGRWASRHGTVGREALFQYRASCASKGTGCPLFTERYIPARPRVVVYLVVEQHTSSGWKVAAIWHHRLNRHSRWTFPIRYANRSVIGPRYRVAAAFNGDDKFTAVAWGYWSFRITA